MRKPQLKRWCVHYIYPVCDGRGKTYQASATVIVDSVNDREARRAGKKAAEAAHPEESILVTAVKKIKVEQ